MARFFTKKIIFTAIAVIAGGSILYFVLKPKPAPSLITVTRGDIAEEVIVTGNTKPVQDISLSFQQSGRVARVYANVGDKVSEDEKLAELDASQLQAQLAQARASVDAAQAKLDSLKIGTRLEDIQITKTAIAKAQQDLANDYNDVLAALNDAYAKANDAVRNQLSALFSSAETASPQLTFSVSDSQIQIDAQSERALASNELNTWKTELVSLNASATNSQSDFDRVLQNGQSHLVTVFKFLSRVMDAVNSANALTSATITTYKTAVTTALSETTTGITNINTAAQNIASQKIVIKQQNDQLSLQLAGSTPEDIRAQEAVVAQAQANVAAIEAQLTQSVIRSPINGTVTREDAKIGQIATPNQTLISVVSIDNLEIDVNVPEVDIGKIMVGNIVHITLDAFPNETFSGKVVKIDPAETVVSGVVNFKVTINFDKPDPRFKSGLTSNLEIETEKKTGILIAPEVVVLQNDSGTFVQKYESGNTTQTPVTLGVRDPNGNVEILSGVNEGDKLVNIGLKTK